MEFGEAGWTIRAYALNTCGIAAGNSLYNLRAFIDWGRGSAGDTDVARAVQQTIMATCPLDYNVTSGLGARVIHLLNVNEERWFVIDGVVYDPNTNTMQISLQTTRWDTNEVTD